MSFEALVATLGRAPEVTHLVALDETVSTNLEAARLAAEGAPDRTVVVARSQTEGRGRAGRRWHSPPGHIYMSVLRRPPWPAERVPQLTLEAAVAVARTVEHATGVRPELKWPNDVLVGGRKCAGILTELRLCGSLVDAVVVGVGLNVAPVAGFPTELAETATSLSDAARQPVGLAGVAASLVRELDAGYRSALARGRFDREGWLGLCAMIGEAVEVHPPGEAPFAARALDVGEDGALVMERAGRRVRVVAGDVTFGGMCRSGVEGGTG